MTAIDNRTRRCFLGEWCYGFRLRETEVRYRYGFSRALYLYGKLVAIRFTYGPNKGRVFWNSNGLTTKVAISRLKAIGIDDPTDTSKMTPIGVMKYLFSNESLDGKFYISGNRCFATKKGASDNAKKRLKKTITYVSSFDYMQVPV